MEEQIKELRVLLDRATLMLKSIEKDISENLSARDELIEEQRTIIENRNDTITKLIDRIKRLEEASENKTTSEEVCDEIIPEIVFQQDEMKEIVEEETELRESREEEEEFSENKDEEELPYSKNDEIEHKDQTDSPKGADFKDIHSMYVEDSSSPAWMLDKPGPHIEDIRDAVSFNDRLLYINDLFGEDKALYDQTIGRLNDMPSLSGAMDYLRSMFSNWDENSDTVYRFYMTIRRRF